MPPNDSRLKKKHIVGNHWVILQYDALWQQLLINVSIYNVFRKYCFYITTSCFFKSYYRYMHFYILDSDFSLIAEECIYCLIYFQLPYFVLFVYRRLRRRWTSLSLGSSYWRKLTKPPELSCKFFSRPDTFDRP